MCRCRGIGNATIRSLDAIAEVNPDVDRASIDLSDSSNGRPDLGDTTLDELRPFLVIDEPTLREVADVTGGEYFRAADAAELVDVFTQLPSQIVLQDEETEISVAFLAAGLVLLVAAYGLTELWNRRS